ncbi:MAG: sodium:calcium antiporter [Gemmatimonadales bacterium]|nr:MAG: sodium:calcium antiporter [Gemmatimonadales bacterium]
MVLHLVLLGIGLVCLLGGGDALVRGSVALAARLGVAPVLIGLTVVAFGTSAPELVVNLLAAGRGSPDLGFGNVIGSNIANIGLILGIAALVAPAPVHRTLVVRDLPLLVVASVVVLALGAPQLLAGGFGRRDGVVLLVLFAGFLTLIAREALSQRAALVREADRIPPGSPWTTGFLLAGGLAGLVVGAELTVRGAVGAATLMGISEAIVGLTVVAVGTSLPELATSLQAARRGQADVAIGNVVGSNLFNLLFIWGTTVTFFPSPIPARGEQDLLVMTAFAAGVLFMGVRGSKVGRVGGAVLLAGYVGYVSWLALR